MAIERFDLQQKRGFLSIRKEVRWRGVGVEVVLVEHEGRGGVSRVIERRPNKQTSEQYTQ